METRELLEDIVGCMELLQTKADELKNTANGDWYMLAQATGLETAVDMLGDIIAEYK